MEALDGPVGRPAHVPRRVFASFITQGDSEEPPNGEYWVGSVTEHVPTRRRNPFTVTITVNEPDDASDEDELVEAEEAHKVGLVKLRDWIVLRAGEVRESIGKCEPRTLSRGNLSDRGVKRSAKLVFASPEEGTR